MKLEKTFEFTLSHRFANGDIASMKFGTLIESSDILSDANPEDIEGYSKKLAEQAYRDTMKDLKRVAKKNKIAKEIYLGLKSAVKMEQDERDAEEILDAQ
jgi:hypothetical protein